MGLPRTFVPGILALLTACGSDAAKPDAMPDAAPRCDPNAPFSMLGPVAGLNTMFDDVSARFSTDELTVVFARRLSTNVYDLYTATRPARDAAFATPELVATANSINNDVWPSMSPDGLMLLFSSDRGTNVTHIYVSKRASTADRFGPATAVVGLMDKEDHPMLASNSSLYFTSPTTVRAGQGLDDIWRAAIDSTGTVSMPVPVLGGINTADSEVTAAVTEDELHIYFRRTTAGEPDIYVASRTTAQDGFGAAMPVPAVALVGVNEVPNWVSADGCALYFHSNAPGGAGGQDLYVALRGSI